MIANVGQVLDFGAARDGIPDSKRGHRIVVDAEGVETTDERFLELDGTNDG